MDEVRENPKDSSKWKWKWNVLKWKSDVRMNEQSRKKMRIESGLGKMWHRRKEDHWRN
jgi:hypothetical protein